MDSPTSEKCERNAAMCLRLAAIRRTVPATTAGDKETYRGTSPLACSRFCRLSFLIGKDSGSRRRVGSCGLNVTRLCSRSTASGAAPAPWFCGVSQKHHPAYAGRSPEGLILTRTKCTCTTRGMSRSPIPPHGPARRRCQWLRCRLRTRSPANCGRPGGG